jgi:roadblock/LC7 domain-containing protein
VVRGSAMTVCSVGNLVCIVENADASVTEVMRELAEVARY